MADERQQSGSEPSASTKLAVDRTRLAYERTTMAWVRTATSLITFGFSLYKFFQIEAEKRAPENTHLLGPTEFALMLISIGLLSLLMDTWESRRDLKALKAQYPDIPRSLATVTAAFVGCLGILALIAIILRL